MHITFRKWGLTSNIGLTIDYTLYFEFYSKKGNNTNQTHKFSQLFPLAHLSCCEVSFPFYRYLHDLCSDKLPFGIPYLVHPWRLTQSSCFACLQMLMILSPYWLNTFFKSQRFALEKARIIYLLLQVTWPSYHRRA